MKHKKKTKAKLPFAILKYECGFCSKKFKTCSGCARHIERKSRVGICFPNDIKVRI